jgi:hypothetical protein
VCYEARQQGCRFSDEIAGVVSYSSKNHAVVAGVTNESRCWSRHPYQNCTVRCRPEFGDHLHIRRATDCRSRLAAERASQGAGRSRTRCSIDGGAEALSLRGVECRVEGAIGRRVEPGAGRRAEERAKSLIDGHIDGCGVCGVESRGHPRIDPPIGGSCLRSSSGARDRAPILPAHSTRLPD